MTRFIGTETEYGIATPTQPGLSPIVTSTHAVVAFAALTSSRERTRWDFAPESPLKDSRGFDLKRYHTVPVVDPNALGVANVLTDGGARFYVDHAHPEFSSPETSDPLVAMIHDKAGDVIMRRAVRAVAELSAANRSILQGHDPCPPLKVYRNNTDGKGASYGAHENYTYSRDTDFSTMAQALIPFFATRQIYAGAGRVGLGQRGQTPGFQISQRADFIEQEISLETTMNRGIVNTRDEPHADAARFGRLHVIIGDTNCSQVSILLKLGATKLVLDAIEAGVDFSHLALARPVEAVTTISRDLTLTAGLPMADGSTATALDIQREYLAASRDFATGEGDKKVVELWENIVGMLDDDPLSTSDLLDWTAKYALVKGFTDRGIRWDSPKLQLVDLQYADIDPQRSLYHALVGKGRMRTLVDPAEITRAAGKPPVDSRAYLRGTFMHHYSDSVVAANWDSLVVSNNQRCVRMVLPDPGMGTEADCRDVITPAGDPVDIAVRLAQRGLVRIDEPD
ncbi:depupylase/deamidase Dop [Corynebacterium mendelii]|uniref:Proteasome accessory factor PafA2 n=1 Tax=Corynebacterium mendelii TaxID=2765362 RepID=A0A939IUS3_9CORY|nr:depupylase/deamidase Dop [Corynebacterium mendelii]MBN9643506.1 proteasome accessory factor PafA2 [Corynebacterium mendelii]